MCNGKTSYTDQIIVANFGNVFFTKLLQIFFLFLHVFYVFSLFFLSRNFYLSVYYIHGLGKYGRTQL